MIILVKYYMERGLTISCLLPYWRRDEQGKESHYQKSSVLLFNDMIYIKNVDPNNIKNILIYYTSCVAPNCVQPFYLHISKINWYIKKIMGIKNLH